jgi:hypothetical protein
MIAYRCPSAHGLARGQSPPSKHVLAEVGNNLLGEGLKLPLRFIP